MLSEITFTIGSKLYYKCPVVHSILPNYEIRRGLCLQIISSYNCVVKSFDRKCPDLRFFRLRFTSGGAWLLIELLL